MDNKRQELLKLVEQLPPEKVPDALELIRSLQLSTPDADIIKDEPYRPQTDKLHQFLREFAKNMNNSLYDLSIHMERKGDKVLSRRLEFSRKRIVEAWRELDSGNK